MMAEVLVLGGKLLIPIQSDLLGDTLEHQFRHWKGPENVFDVSTSRQIVDLLRNWQ